jgi:hypothetical protein
MGKENSREETQAAHKGIVLELLAPLRGHFIVFHPADSSVGRGAAPIWRTQVKKDIEQLNAYE